MKEIARIQPKRRESCARQEGERKAKALSFSLFGDKLIYLTGAIRNVELQPKFYPGWHCRFYVAEDLWPPLIDELADGGAEIIIMRPEPGLGGLFWRFLAMDDENLDACVSLDADSRPTERQKKATEEWLSSNKAYHIMRDHPYHKRRIMGGLFGAKRNNSVVLNMRQDIEKFQLHQKRTDVKRNDDQEFLKQIIYPRIKDHVLIHTDYQRFPNEKVTPFPISSNLKEGFVGMICQEDEPLLALRLAITALKKFHVRVAHRFLRYSLVSFKRLYILRKA